MSLGKVVVGLVVVCVLCGGLYLTGFLPGMTGKTANDVQDLKIKVLNPLGCVTWQTGSSVNIQWETTGNTSEGRTVDLAYYIPNWDSDLPIAEKINDTGQYPWVIPSIIENTSGTIKIKVTDSNGGTEASAETGNVTIMKVPEVPVPECHLSLERTVIGPLTVYIRTLNHWDLRYYVNITGGYESTELDLSIPQEITIDKYSSNIGGVQVAEVSGVRNVVWALGSFNSSFSAVLELAISTVKNSGGIQEFEVPGTHEIVSETKLFDEKNLCKPIYELAAVLVTAIEGNPDTGLPFAKTWNLSAGRAFWNDDPNKTHSPPAWSWSVIYHGGLGADCHAVSPEGTFNENLSWRGGYAGDAVPCLVSLKFNTTTNLEFVVLFKVVAKYMGQTYTLLSIENSTIIQDSGSLLMSPSSTADIYTIWILRYTEGKYVYIRSDETYEIAPHKAGAENYNSGISIGENDNRKQWNGSGVHSFHNSNPQCTYYPVEDSYSWKVVYVAGRHAFGTASNAMVGKLHREILAMIDVTSPSKFHVQFRLYSIKHLDNLAYHRISVNTSDGVVGITAVKDYKVVDTTFEFNVTGPVKIPIYVDFVLGTVGSAASITWLETPTVVMDCGPSPSCALDDPSVPADGSVSAPPMSSAIYAVPAGKPSL